jgi:uncharacterized C2H2 Zn-finger protein
MAKEQEQDPEIQPVLTALKADKKPTRNESASWPKATRRYLADWARLKLRDGVVWREWYDDKGAVTAHQFITPRSLRGEVMQQAHDQRMAGHFGVARTLDRLRAHYYWSGMTGDVDHWLRSCGVCACRKAPPKRPHHALERQVVAEPNQRVAIDILGPFEPPADSGNLHIMVMTDYLTKWVEAVPMPDKTQERCAEVFVVHWVLRFGPPEQLLTDQGAQFEARMFQEVCRMLDIEKLRTTAYHPQGDGQTERANRTILALLNKLAVDTPRNWDVRLPFALAAYRSSVHTVTRMTPNRLMHGQEARTPLALLVPSPPRAATTAPYCQQLKARFEDTHRLVAETIKHQHRTAQPHLDRRSKMMVFKEGDLVWLYKPNLHKGISRKMAKECWSGPWEVVKVITACVYTIRFRGTRMTRTVNVDVLNPYVTRSASRFPEREKGAKRREEVQAEEDTTESHEAEEERRTPNDPGVTAELITGQSEHTAGLVSAAGERAEITGRPRRLHKPPPRLNDFIVRQELKTCRAINVSTTMKTTGKSTQPRKKVLTSCTPCGKVFSSRAHWRRHVRKAHEIARGRVDYQNVNELLEKEGDFDLRRVLNKRLNNGQGCSNPKNTIKRCKTEPSPDEAILDDVVIVLSSDEEGEGRDSMRDEPSTSAACSSKVRSTTSISNNGVSTPMINTNVVVTADVVKEIPSLGHNTSDVLKTKEATKPQPGSKSKTGQKDSRAHTGATSTTHDSGPDAGGRSRPATHQDASTSHTDRPSALEGYEDPKT